MMRFFPRSLVTSAFRCSRAPPVLAQLSFAHQAAASTPFTTAIPLPHRRWGLYDDLVVVYTADELRDQAAQLEQEQAALNVRIAELDALVVDFDPYTREDVQDALVVASRVADLKRAGHIALDRVVRAGGLSKAAAGGDASLPFVGAAKVDGKRPVVIASHYVNGVRHETGKN